MYGAHLMLDLYGCDGNKVRDLNQIFDFLDEMPAKIGMTKITRPCLVLHKDKPGDEPGITGAVFIAESHISIHTFPSRENYVTMDVYSCKMFDKKKVTQMIADELKPKRIDAQFVIRGREFEKTIYGREAMAATAKV